MKVSDMITEIDLITLLVKERASGTWLAKFKPFEQAVKGHTAAKVQDILITT